MAPPLSVGTIVERTVLDQVISRSELKRDATRTAVAGNLGDYIQRLDQYAGLMTSTASDAYARAKTIYAADPAANLPAALQILRDSAADQAKLPAWVPANFDFALSATGARNMILRQGDSPESIDGGQVKKLLFMDADLTFLDTSTPTMIVKKGTENNPEPEFLRYPPEAPAELRGRLVMLGGRPDRDTGKELAALKLAYPAIDWPAYGNDYREFGSLVEILRTSAIPEDLELMKKSALDPTSRDFVITARSAPATWMFLEEYLRGYGVDTNGIFAVSTPAVGAEVALGAAISSAQKKALTMAAIIATYGGAEKIKNLEFRDDTDANLFAAMELLPKLFPTIKMKFYDIVHVGENQFDNRLVAFTTLNGELAGPSGHKLSLDAIKGYQGGDAPFPIDPIFRPHV